MPNRYIRDSLNMSKSLGAVSLLAEVLFTHLILAADDYEKSRGRKMRFPPSMPPLCGLTSTGEAAPFHCCTALLSLFTAFGRGEPGDRAVHSVKMCQMLR